MKKERVDVLLVERGLAETREKAKRAVMAGIVYSNDLRMDKAGEKIATDAPLSIKGQVMPYVSRGGYKLEKAMETFTISVKDKLMIDIGSSTGGFTDCALQNGAKKSYAVDVGYNQLAWKLRQDPRVVVMERTNFRHSVPEDFTEGLPEFATIDVSFISLKLILPALKRILVPGSDVVSLVKPQFEAGREQVGKKGIIRDKKVHLQVVEQIRDFAIQEGYILKEATFSPITGGDGNIEFLFHLYWPGEGSDCTQDVVVNLEQVVEAAHEALKTNKGEDK
ncbi:TlyA family RNA methyltransferase [Pradoshia sp. D12]|uniref:TlyA family RNA methyltransferase n=1 Tax=Bacillaceae TaxID=186817 RepID=UPI00080ACB47|nr:MULTISPECIES: TlyA family RNA methyltransferase [Bacillaceae]OCA86329.1 rRNA methyltransferase [Bacillus sp. FJAT-27986]QFK72129.1 TlyA family RNA methyltransferase [Pradoshia sp. D12]TPF71379.1 TlyA family RNA methyltransferase [Bacillus sp. D12]